MWQLLSSHQAKPILRNDGVAVRLRIKPPSFYPTCLIADGDAELYTQLKRDTCGASRPASRCGGAWVTQAGEFGDSNSGKTHLFLLFPQAADVTKHGDGLNMVKSPMIDRQKRPIIWEIYGNNVQDPCFVDADIF